MGQDRKLLLAASGVAAGLTGLWALLRWKKYRVLFEPIQTADGVQIKHMVPPARGALEEQRQALERCTAVLRACMWYSCMGLVSSCWVASWLICACPWLRNGCASLRSGMRLEVDLETTGGQAEPKKVVFGKVEGEDRGENAMDPPVVREDDLFWLRDDNRQDPYVLAHLHRENAHFDVQFKPLKKLQNTIYREFLSHIKETDEEVPYPWGDFFYYTRTVKGKAYPIHCRKRSVGGAPGGPEQLVLDVNAVGRGKAFCDVQAVVPSPDHTLVAYCVDFSGYETYQVVILDMATGRATGEVLEGCFGDVSWGRTSKELFYTTMDAEHRPDKAWRHVLGQPQAQDECLHEEPDALFEVDVEVSCSGRFLFVNASSMCRSETRFLDLDTPRARLTLIEPKRKDEDHRYSVEHWGEHFFIITNADKCVNSKLVKTPISKPGRVNWVDVLPYHKTTKLDYLVCFKGHIVLNGRSNGDKMLKVMDMNTGEVADLKFDEDCFDVFAKRNKVFETTQFRFGYSSLITPSSTFEYDMEKGVKVLLHEKEAPNYDRSLYATKRTFCTARDGVKVPISMVFRKDSAWATEKRACPMMLYAYGSYGMCIDPAFDPKCISYLDRGMVYAIAHIRGGGEMGREWYEDMGKFLTKKNTFTDFCDCAEHLIKTGVTTAERLACSGRSAGGLLVGNVINMRPDLFKAAVGGVPFVDLMTTMSDPSIPLTIGEWEEWGNPNEKKFFDYMLSYSPIDNVRAVEYPHLLVTAGLNDPRVAYWEPAKWVARLRQVRVGKGQVLLKTDMSSGHFAASNRYFHMQERSIEFAFVTHHLGCEKLL